MKYAVGIDVGFQDETVAVLVKLENDKIYIIKEKSTSVKGENKITEKMKFRLVEYERALKLGYIGQTSFNLAVLLLLGWGDYDSPDTTISIM